MAALLKRIRCMIGRHSPSRRAVQYEGHLKVGPCRYCGRDLEKRGDGQWVSRNGGRRPAGDATTRLED